MKKRFVQFVFRRFITIDVIVLGAILTSWIVGICVDQQIIFTLGTRGWNLASGEGDVRFTKTTWAYMRPHTANGLHLGTMVYGFYPGHQVWRTIRQGFNANFSIQTSSQPAPKDGSEALISVWFMKMPIWLTMIPPGVGVAVGLYRRETAKAARNRMRAGLCLNCGYDLRATPHECPECGNVS
jgi:hypothetical protein